MKLKCETTIDLDADDLATLLTEEFCGAYSKFEALRVEFITVKDDFRTFTLTMTPKPGKQDEAA